MKRKALLQLFIVHNNSIKDFFRIMKISLFLLFVCVFQLMATNMEAQNAVINIRQNSLSIKQLIKEIEKQTDYLVVFRNQDVDVDKVISFQKRSGKVSDYLDEIYENTNLSYVFENNYITLSPKVEVANQNKKKITGKVTDQNGESVIGASVVEKGTTNGIMTDMDGLFTLEVEEAAVVQVSYIGYRTKDISVAGKNNIQVQLIEDMQALDEVVVVGFGTQKKVNLTGSVSMVNSEVLESRPVQNVGQALQGVVPGLNLSVNKTGGELNNTLDIDVRGVGTIGEGSKSSPLVLIDGIEGDMNSINPNDIESISVLKDAASSAIYGSRAAFGVILITTKEGKAGRTQVNYSSNVRFTTPLSLPTMMDSYQFAQFFNRAAANQGASPAFDETTMQRIIDYQAGKITSGSQVRPDGHFSENVLANGNVDWFKETYRKAVPSHEHNLSVSGGNEKITYLVSGSFMNQNGLIAYNSDDFKRYTLNARIKAELSKYVTLAYGAKWIREDYKKPSYFGDLFYDSIARTWPVCPIRDDNGNYLGSIINRLVYGGEANDQKDQTYNQLQLIVEPIKNWKFYAEGNMRTINRMNHSERLLVPWWFASGEASWSPAGGQTTSVDEESFRDNYLTGNLYTDYFKQFDSGHYFKAMVGFNAELMKSRDLKGSMDNLISIDLPTLNTATENPRASGGYTHWSTVGFFGRLNYNYKERYMLEVNMRYDGTSRFLGDKQWGVFPSFSAGWNIAREDFFQNMGNLNDYISMLKLRASWGQLGNTNTENLYPFYLTMPVGNVNGSWLVDGQKTNTSYAPGIVSSLMTWETVESWNVGLDWGVLDNRLTGSFDYFVRNTLDMIGPAPELPSILGTKVPKINNADMKSSGFELELGWRDRIGDFNYGAKVVLSDNKREVTRYPNEKGDYAQWYTGKMSGEYWGYETIGIAKTQEEMDQHLASLPNGGQDALGTKWSAGDIMYKDLNGDGKIDAGSSTLGDSGDKKIIGNNTPRYRYGVTLDGSWKGFDLNLFFQGVAKRDYILEGPYFWGAKNGQWHSVGFEEHWDFFRPEGDPLGANLNSYYPRPLFDQGGKNQEYQTRYLQNAAYIRLKNVQLGYTFPRTWVSKIGLQSLRLYFSGDNLLTFTKLHGYFDPETLGDTGDKTGKVYPLAKTLSVGLNINF
ncbi:TonB-dependent receptor [Parabacteroides sp. GYB001]|uniref:TonB-dependent receptor n=2 Tax=Parabacteroides leei TaxID=2939491 RepID=UPI0020175AE5|nr:TonB-dependent receptor [Parabacteroides leei]MCL3852724.1 TonB-dependent receptor [Parabacteroides leei]